MNSTDKPDKELAEAAFRMSSKNLQGFLEEEGKLNSAHSKREGWEEAAVKASLRFDAHPVNTYLIAIDDFKSALRKEIEREIKRLQQIQLMGDLTTYGSGSLRTAKEILELLDTISPPKQ